MASRKPRPVRARDLTSEEARAIFAALYSMTDHLNGKSKRVRFLILSALCSTYLVEGEELAALAPPGKGGARG